MDCGESQRRALIAATVGKLISSVDERASPVEDIQSIEAGKVIPHYPKVVNDVA